MWTTPGRRSESWSGLARGARALDVGACEQRLDHAGADRHRPVQRGPDLVFRAAGLPRTHEATLRSGLTVSGEDDRQTDEGFGPAVERVGVPRPGVKSLELLGQLLVLSHRVLLCSRGVR